MKKMSETVVFFGSGPVAAKSLELLKESFDIEAVVTKPIPEHFRGTYPVIDVANQYKIPLHTPKNKAELTELFGNQPVSSKIGIVIDYGIIIEQPVIDYFPLGIVNSHFSLLPLLRGADPISYAILEGFKKTGVSLMVIDAGLDTGMLIAQQELALTFQETTPVLTDKLIRLSDAMLSEYLPQYVSGKIKPTPQPNQNQVTYSKKLTKSDGIIDWNKPAEQIEREVRAYADWPASHANIGGKDVIITEVTVGPETGKPGNYNIEHKELTVYCKTGSLKIKKLKPLGKKEMNVQSFLAGYATQLR